MKSILIIAALALVSVSAMAQTSAPAAERAIKLSIEINASVADVWSRWTTPEGIAKFFAPACEVDAVPLGRYNIYFAPNAPVGQKGAEGNHIMAIQDKKMLSFTWDAPPSFPEIRKQRTLVILRFTSLAEKKTLVTLTQTGWGEGQDWDTVYGYFGKAWGEIVLPFLKYSLENGPVDMSDFPRSAPKGLTPAVVLK